MNEREIREAIDACRPGSDDLSLPEMAELADLIRRDSRVRQWYERAQRFDATIGEAFRDVQPPDGLLSRLLASACLPESPAGMPGDHLAPATCDTSSEQGGAAQPGTAPVERRRAVRSWRLVWIGPLTAAAAILLLALIPFWRRSAPPIDGGRIADAADQWIHSVMQDQAPWRDLQSGSLEPYPCPAALKVRPSAWRPFDARLPDRSGPAPLGHPAAVYELRSKTGQRQALLFVVRTSRRLDVRNTPPVPPTQGTGGWSIGIWREQQVLYVLAVKGDVRRYQSLIKPPHGLACRPPALRPIA
jgi:hypothetical protein